ncbi:hypothetical protein PR048_012432 [Dryococelus australis]|uniref:N-acetyltransferase domain-containing protein n=1 Tax=Dryococelus australis TaxID=614101 RepID=A0ABQ9HQR3_9NEOP|nr:hypothetical protein PR048_012432 [Dryococelus australis]
MFFTFRFPLREEITRKFILYAGPADFSRRGIGERVVDTMPSAIDHNLRFCRDASELMPYQLVPDSNTEHPAPQTGGTQIERATGGRGDVAIRALASHQSELGSVPDGLAPGLGIVPDEATGRRIFSGISRYPRSCIQAPLNTSLHPQRVYNEVSFAIGSELIRHALDESTPIADLQGNKKRIPYCKIWGNAGTTANEQTSEGNARFALLFGIRLNFTVLYELEPASFLHWLLHICKDTPSLTELHMIGYTTVKCSFIGAESLRVSHKVWSNDKPVSLLAFHPGDPGSIPNRLTPDFRMYESFREMPLVGGFSRGYPVSTALSFRRCSILTSINLIGSQVLDVKSPVSLLTSHHGEPGLILSRANPRLPHVGIVPDDVAGWRIFSGITRFPHPCISVLLHSQDPVVKSCPNLSTKLEQLRWTKIGIVAWKVPPRLNNVVVPLMWAYPFVDWLREAMKRILCLIGFCLLPEIPYWLGCRPASRLPRPDRRMVFRQFSYFLLSGRPRALFIVRASSKDDPEMIFLGVGLGGRGFESVIDGDSVLWDICPQGKEWNLKLESICDHAY